MPTVVTISRLNLARLYEQLHCAVRYFREENGLLAGMDANLLQATNKEMIAASLAALATFCDVAKPKFTNEEDPGKFLIKVLPVKMDRAYRSIRKAR